MAFRVVNKKTNKIEIVHEVIVDYKKDRNENEINSNDIWFYIYDYESGRWTCEDPNHYKPYREA